MSVWKKLVTAIKGGANEAAEAVADSQALRILEQEIREARQELRRSDEALTSIMAKRKLAHQKVDAIRTSIAEYESHARAAMTKENRELALECAQRVSELKNEQDAEQAYLDQFTASESTLKDNISTARNRLRQLEQQLDVVKATDSVQKAQAAVSSRHTGANSRMKTAVESLDRIKQKQTQRQAELDVAAERAATESGDALEQKLKSAGITGSQSAGAEDELARILGK
ncbi:PspA/IM30 family protein [Oceanimonas baumannii]|uniref:Phage shock protein A n=1 Tax=Oceanimonas baumannii TaxID=129578 RepID=A0A235CGI8_9GAMM|nr:PspA/IM30 family protein [Oceanimonas baumannii]OYD23576.1 phage shock protein A [Oceanimonas baumannii]TDW56887.1 phage shock protein A (PspA) family protein [Oceanimonas baumannii]